MNLQGYRETFYTYSGKASDLTRQLAFAGIAVIWLFKKEPVQGLTIPHELIFPGLLIVTCLAFDLAQYGLGSLLWYIFYKSRSLWLAVGANEVNKVSS